MAAMLMHDDHLSADELELVFLRNDVQPAPVASVHQDGADLVHAGFSRFHIDALIAFMLSSLRGARLEINNEIHY